MKRTFIAIAAVALVLLIGAGSTLAATITGTFGNDKLAGTANADTISARAGNDIVYGGGGNDMLYGQQGDDILYGGTGGDLIVGDVGSDRLYGQDGNDSINSAINDGNRDLIFCGAGVDVARVQGEDVVDGINASNLFSSRQTACERLYVNGFLTPSI